VTKKQLRKIRDKKARYKERVRKAEASRKAKQ
jgi:hypothetical protein